MESYTSGSGYVASVPEEISIHQPIVKEAKNFIMLIGDGMGVYQTQLFDYMENSYDFSDGENIFYGYMLPYLGYSRTESLSGVTDSAAGGTALSCGYKTINEYVGIDKDKNVLKSLTELAFEMGKAGAVMSTENSTGATPSTFSVHVENRDDKSDIILAQFEATTKYGTVIDCGFDYYTKRYMKVIEDHIETTLDTVSANENGFFLMVEGSQIDTRAHENNIWAEVGEMRYFDNAIAVALNFVCNNPDTVLVITADHETGGLELPQNLTKDNVSECTYQDTGHTAANVPVFAIGYGTEKLGVEQNNTDIAKFLFELLNK
jgi:alkaline phosphatase